LPTTERLSSAACASAALSSGKVAPMTGRIRVRGRRDVDHDLTRPGGRIVDVDRDQHLRAAESAHLDHPHAADAATSRRLAVKQVA
jgi:hypothetical protein